MSTAALCDVPEISEASSTGIRKVVLVILDGLRPDAIQSFGLTTLPALMASSAFSVTAQTVQPSITVSAMASVMTGVPPTYHGIQSERFHIPRKRGTLHPVPRVLAEAGLSSSAFLLKLPVVQRVIARRVVAALGLGQATFEGTCAEEILEAARPTLRTRHEGLIFLHWPDADIAGHSEGWMSPAYADGARALDRALASLLEELQLDRFADTLLIVAADHGGGGAALRDHESQHPLDTTIPIVLAGQAVQAGVLSTPCSILDIPATVLWALGVALPSNYSGQVLTDAFRRVDETMPAFAA